MSATAGPAHLPGVAFLIDADNLNEADAVDEAFAKLHALAGPSTVRRAYGGNDALRGLGSVLNRHAVRPCVNFVLDKNTTDIALAVDAMELACGGSMSVIALGSGDADFYPLVVRLRERGVRVIGFTLRNKMSAEMRDVYPELHIVGQTPRPRAAETAQAVAPARAPRKTPAKKVPAKKAVAKVAASVPVTPPAAPRETARPKAASAPAAKGAAGKSSGTPDVQAILDAVPSLRQGQPERLNEVAQQLHAAGVLGKSASSLRLLGKWPEHFELTPPARPQFVRWTAR